MRTLDLYLAKLFLKNLLLAAVSLSTLFFFQGMLNDLYNHEFASQDIFIHHVLNLPLIFVQMTPPAVLLATLLTLSGLNRSHELIAAQAIGYSLWRICAIFFSLILCTSALILKAEDTLLPQAHAKRTQFFWRTMKKIPDFNLNLNMEKIWYRSKNLIYNLQKFDPKQNTISGLTIYHFDDQFQLTQVTTAQRATFDGQLWQLQQGTLSFFQSEEDFPTFQAFQEKALRLQETPADFMSIEQESESLNFQDLATYIGKMKQAGADTRKFEVKYQARISTAFIALVMGLLAVPFAVGHRRSGGLAKDLALCLMMTFFYWLSYSVSLSLGISGVLSPVLAAWLPSLIFFLLAQLLLLRKRA